MQAQPHERWHYAWHIIEELPLTNDDKAFLRDNLSEGEPEIQKTILWQYWKAWRAAEEAEPVDHKRPNAGRHAANLWLRQEVEQLRHAEPEVVRKYKEVVNNPPPRCCHTCAYYTDEGQCSYYGMEPPEDFAATLDACPTYKQEVPF